MTATMNPNGKTVRKSLADQIDRLDQILDGLAEGINETMTTAVQDAREGGRPGRPVAEVLTNAELAEVPAQQPGHRQRSPTGPPPSRSARSFKGWLGWVTGPPRAPLTAGLKKVGWVCAEGTSGS